MNTVTQGFATALPLGARVLIPDDECNYSRFLPFCLKQVDPGLQIVVAGTNGDSLSRYSRAVDKFIALPQRSDARERVDDWRELIRDQRIDWLMLASETGARFAIRNHAQLTAEAGIVSLPSEQSLVITMDKWLQFQSLSTHDVPMPATVPLDPDQLPPWLPCIIKPRRGSQGIGIHLLNDSAEWSRFDFSALGDQPYVAQKYVAGYDIDCSVYCERGRIVAYTIQKPLGSESGFSPRIEKLKFEDRADVLDVAQRALSALEWQGVAHLDLRIDEATGQCLLVEINPRYWASIMGSYYAGVNFPSIALRSSLHLPLPEFGFRERHYVSIGRTLKDTLKGCRDYGLAESQLPFLAADPLPAAARIWQKFRTRISPGAK